MQRKLFCWVASVSERRRGGASVLSLKMGSRIFKQRAPKLTCSELTAPRGEYAALRRAKSAFVFAVKSQSSPQLIESVLSLILGLEPRERKKLRHSAEFFVCATFSASFKDKTKLRKGSSRFFPCCPKSPKLSSSFAFWRRRASFFTRYKSRSMSPSR